VIAGSRDPAIWAGEDPCMVYECEVAFADAAGRMVDLGEVGNGPQVNRVCLIPNEDEFFPAKPYATVVPK